MAHHLTHPRHPTRDRTDPRSQAFSPHPHHHPQDVYDQLPPPPSLTNGNHHPPPPPSSSNGIHHQRSASGRHTANPLVSPVTAPSRQVTTSFPEPLQRLAKANEETYLVIGSISEQMNDLDRALGAYENAIRHNPKSLTALLRVAAIARMRDDIVKAVDYWQRVLEIQPENGEIWGAIGHCYLMQDELQKAYTAYQQALYHLPNPKDPKLWYGIGILYDRYGSLEHAEEAFSSVIRMDPNFDKSDEIFFRLGIIYKQQQKYEKSLDCFDKILQRPPTPLAHGDIYFQIGHVYEQQKDYDHAKDAYERVLAESPHHAKVLQQLGWLYHQTGSSFCNQEIAIQCLTKSLESDATDAQSWYLLGRAYMAVQKYQKAYEAYQQAVYRDGRNPTFWCSIGVLYYNINQYRDALDAYSRAIKINPFISEVWFDLGSLYESCNNQISDAIDAYQRAVDLDPTNPVITQRLTLLKHVQATGGAMPDAPGPRDVHPTAYASTGPPTVIGHPPRAMMPTGPSGANGSSGEDLPGITGRQLPAPLHSNISSDSQAQQQTFRHPEPFRGGDPPPLNLDERRMPHSHAQLAPMDTRPPTGQGYHEPGATPHRSSSGSQPPAPGSSLLLHHPQPQATITAISNMGPLPPISRFSEPHGRASSTSPRDRRNRSGTPPTPFQQPGTNGNRGPSHPTPYSYSDRTAMPGSTPPDRTEPWERRRGRSRDTSRSSHREPAQASPPHLSHPHGHGSYPPSAPYDSRRRLSPSLPAVMDVDRRSIDSRSPYPPQQPGYSHSERQHGVSLATPQFPPPPTPGRAQEGPHPPRRYDPRFDASEREPPRDPWVHSREKDREREMERERLREKERVERERERGREGPIQMQRVREERERDRESEREYPRDHPQTSERGYDAEHSHVAPPGRRTRAELAPEPPYRDSESPAPVSKAAAEPKEKRKRGAPKEKEPEKEKPAKEKKERRSAKRGRGDAATPNTRQQSQQPSLSSPLKRSPTSETPLSAESRAEPSPAEQTRRHVDEDYDEGVADALMGLAAYRPPGPAAQRDEAALSARSRSDSDGSALTNSAEQSRHTPTVAVSVKSEASSQPSHHDPPSTSPFRHRESPPHSPRQPSRINTSRSPPPRSPSGSGPASLKRTRSDSPAHEAPEMFKRSRIEILNPRSSPDRLPSEPTKPSSPPPKSPTVARYDPTREASNPSPRAENKADAMAVDPPEGSRSRSPSSSRPADKRSASPPVSLPPITTLSPAPSTPPTAPQHVRSRSRSSDMAIESKSNSRPPSEQRYVPLLPIPVAAIDAVATYSREPSPVHASEEDKSFPPTPVGAA